MTRQPISDAKPPGGVQPVVADDPKALADRIRALRTPGGRVLVGIAGAPGSGKSTLSAAVLAELTGGQPAVVTALVPMDGYHLAQQVLDRAGLAEIKGAPETFDSAGYVALLERLTAVPNRDTDEVIYAPEFRRAIEEPIAGALPVSSDVEVVLTEGNYLLAQVPPWHRVAQLLTQTWYLDVPEHLRLARLVSRHVAFGRTQETAWLRSTTGTDGRNAAFVAATKERADLLIRPC